MLSRAIRAISTIHGIVCGRKHGRPAPVIKMDMLTLDIIGQSHLIQRRQPMDNRTFCINSTSLTILMPQRMNTSS
jgi:hypothetical protein